MGVQVEAIYNTISQKYTEVDVTREVTLKYVNIPLMLAFNSGRNNIVNLNVVAGPQIGISAGSSLLTSGSGTINNNAVLSVKKGDLGFAYGLGLDFGLKTSIPLRLTLGYRGVLGLIDISNNNGSLTTDSYYLLDKTHINTNSGYIGLSLLF